MTIRRKTTVNEGIKKAKDGKAEKHSSAMLKWRVQGEERRFIGMSRDVYRKRTFRNAPFKKWGVSLPNFSENRNRSFSLSRNKNIYWKPSNGRSQENEML